MQVEKDIISIISNKTGKDKRVVATIATHPLYFFKQIAQDVNDHRPVRIRYFGCFAIKADKDKRNRYLKTKDKQMNGLEDIYNNTVIPKENKILVINYEIGGREFKNIVVYRNKKFYSHFTGLECTFNLDNIINWKYATAKEL